MSTLAMGPLLPQSSFSTERVPAEHRFEAWRSALAGSHEVRADPRGFSGRLRTIQADRLLVSVIDSSPIALHRSARQVGHDGHDHFVIHLSRHPIRAEAADLAVLVPAGAISVNDLSRCMRREAAPETGSIAARVPRDLLREAIGDCDGFHGRILAAGAGVLLSAHLRQLVEQAATIPADAAPDVARATAYLLAACLRPTGSTLGEARPAIEAAKLARARSYIDAHLGRPELTPDLVGRAVGLSRSALYRAFEPVGGVSAYIWSRRLRAVCSALLDQDDRRAVAQIGYAFGFTSSSHLSRAFRREFGVSPRDIRPTRLYEAR